ncbi:condensation domain-containing protein [Methylorubrum sp. POS3]|uniref:condensation domain-containing protein n=1 Tax=Methylorubrum sp. POS3 TaxID=2998492 RepID=UPI003728AF21
MAYVAGRGPAGDAAQGEADLAAILSAHLAARLPAHLRPSLIVELAALPRLASGKLDRSGLPAPDWRGRDAAPPQGATETALAGLWTALLGVERVGRTDGFFERGGHSLLAAKLVARIRAEFGRDLPLRAVFEAPGLAALAARIEAAPAVAAETNMAVPRAPRDRAVPATDMQAGLWHWQRRHPDSSAWTIFGALRLSGPLDTDALRASFDRIVARHEALRTTFRAGAAGLELVVHPSAPIRIERLDLTDRPRSDIETAALGFAQNQAERPFDMAVDLPIRVGLVRLGRQDHVLTLAVHHAAGDGRSMAVLLDEFGAGYRAFAGGSEPGLPEPARQAIDYAAWRRAQDRTPAAEARLAETLERLSGPWRPDPVPTDRPRRPDLGMRGARIRFEIPGAAVLRLAANARALNATLPMAAMAALGIALRRRSDRDAMSLGILVADRGPSELETVMGCLVATDLAVLEIDPAQSFARILTAVRDERLAAQAAGPVPYARLLDALARRDRLSHAAAPFQVLFSYLRVEPESADLLAGLRARDFPVADTDESFELEFDFKERADGGLAVSIGYLTALFDSATVEALAQDLSGVLEAAARDPDRPAARLWPPPALPDEAA